MDLFLVQADFSSLWFPEVLFGNFGAMSKIIRSRRNLAPLLRGIVLIG